MTFLKNYKVLCVIGALLISYLAFLPIRANQLTKHAENFFKDALEEMFSSEKKSPLFHLWSDYAVKESPFATYELDISSKDSPGTQMRVKAYKCALDKSMDSFSNQKEIYALCKAAVGSENSEFIVGSRLIFQDRKDWKIRHMLVEKTEKK